MNTEAKELRKQNEALEDILSRLIALKNYKDRHGKDETYEKEQPVLWQVARETLYQCVGTPVPDTESGLHLADVVGSALTKPQLELIVECKKLKDALHDDDMTTVEYERYKEIRPLVEEMLC